MKRPQLLCLWTLLLLQALHGSTFASPPPMPPSVLSADDAEATRLERALLRAQRRLNKRRSGAPGSRRPRKRAERRHFAWPISTRGAYYPHRRLAPVPDLTRSLAIGVRLSASTAAGAPVRSSAATEPVLSGAGLQVRGRLTPRLSTELTVDALRVEGRDMVQTTTPLMVALAYHPVPHRRVQPYALVGAGVHLTSLSFPGARLPQGAAELAAQVGAGVEVFLSRDISLHGDLRGHGVVLDPRARGRMEAQCIRTTSNVACGRLNSPDVGEKVTLGLQVGLGASLHF